MAAVQWEPRQRRLVPLEVETPGPPSPGHSLCGHFSALYFITVSVMLTLSPLTPIRGPEPLVARPGRRRVIPQKQVRMGMATPPTTPATWERLRGGMAWWKEMLF